MSPASSDSLNATVDLIELVSSRIINEIPAVNRVVLDSDSGKVVATPAIGGDPDGLAFDHDTIVRDAIELSRWGS